MDVCVIGAGPSGLTTIKQLLDEGHNVTCFEKGSSVGGIWHRHDGDTDEMKVYDNLILTISMKLMAFSDFMVEKDRVFYNHKQYLHYLERYADQFGLRERVVVHSKVESISKTPTGQWKVAVEGPDGRKERTFDAVAVCTGPFTSPNMDVQDLDKFTGEVSHSSRYRNPKSFQGKRVLVVGLAESGADILREVSDVASACTLSLRSYSFVLPRLYRGDYATDSGTMRAHHYEMRVRVADIPFRMKALFGDSRPSRALFLTAASVFGIGSVVAKAVSSAVQRKERTAEGESDGAKNLLGAPMFPKKIDLDAEWTLENMQALHEWNKRSQDGDTYVPKSIFCKNARFVPNVVNGKIRINDVGIKRIEGRRVFFNDDTSQEFDSMVLCTGFKRDFSKLFRGDKTVVKDNNVRNLYKHAFNPDHEGLAFIGFVRPFTGAIPVCSEMQARYFAALCSKRVSLPVDVWKITQEDKEWEEFQVSRSPRHTEAIPSQVFFCDSIAKELGCLTPMSELIRNPKLFVRHWFYTFNQASYRLVGAHNMQGRALEEMMSETPGPMGTPNEVLWFSLAAMLPRFMRPVQSEPGSSNRVFNKGVHPPSKPTGRLHDLSPREPRPTIGRFDQAPTLTSERGEDVGVARVAAKELQT